MFKRRNVSLLLAAVAIILTSVVCGYGSASPAPAPLPTADINAVGTAGPTTASASTEVFAPTAVSMPTSIPIIILPTATAGALIPVTGGPPPAIPETRRLTLEYPGRIRAGDSDIVRLTLEVDTLGNVTPTAEIGGHTVTGHNVEIPNLYETHIVIAEARLDLAGVEVRPSDQTSEPLLPGQAVTFFWSVHPTNAGTYRGTAWLFLRFIDKITKEESHKALAAQTVQISATDFLGLNGNLARAAGGFGSVVGAVLGFPFVDEVLKWLWKQIRRGG